jgi:hypothetical protein
MHAGVKRRSVTACGRVQSHSGLHVDSRAITCNAAVCAASTHLPLVLLLALVNLAARLLGHGPSCLQPNRAAAEGRGDQQWLLCSGACRRSSMPPGAVKAVAVHARMGVCMVIPARAAPPPSPSRRHRDREKPRTGTRRRSRVQRSDGRWQGQRSQLPTAEEQQRPRAAQVPLGSLHREKRGQRPDTRVKGHCWAEWFWGLGLLMLGFASLFNYRSAA